MYEVCTVEEALDEGQQSLLLALQHRLAEG